MLGKLIKNEFRATARTFGAMYLIVFIVTVLLKLVIEIQDAFQLDNVVINILSFVTITAFVLGIIGVIIGTFILILKRFYDNMLKNEGYLSFTLPATVGQHIASKSIVSYIWVIVSAVFIFGIVIILFLGHTSLFVDLRQDIIYIVRDNFNPLLPSRRRQRFTTRMLSLSLSSHPACSRISVNASVRTGSLG